MSNLELRSALGATNSDPIRVLCTAPIPVDVLRRKFTEDIEFVIDYKNSTFKNKIFITYLSNLDLKCRLQMEDVDEVLTLVEHYMRHPGMAKIEELLEIVMHILLAYLGKPCRLTFDPTDFIIKNKDIIDVWMTRLASLYLFGLYIDLAVPREYFQERPQDTDYSLAGINYVHLIQHPHLGLLLEGIPDAAIKYNQFFFNQYVFGGQNLYYHFAVKENPLYLGVMIRHRTNTDDFNRLLHHAVERDYVPSAG